MRGNLCAGYCRCSTAMQERSILDQQKEIQLFAEKNNLKIIRWFIDEDRSGTSIENREGFQEMRRLVEQGENDFSAILIYDLSRWGRFPDPRESIYWEIYFEKRGVDILYTNDDVQNTKSFQSAIVKAVKHAAAGDYSRRLSILITRACVSQASEGFWNGGLPPYGYKRAEVDKNHKVVRFLARGERCHNREHNLILVLGDRKEVQIVKNIFDYFVNKRVDIRTIAAMLNYNRVPAPSKKWDLSIKSGGGEVQVEEGITTWSYCSVYKILRNGLYTGKILWGRKKRGVFPKFENSWGDKEGKKSLHDKQNVIECDGAHAPIISRMLFDKTREIIENGRDRKHIRRENRASPFLLGGMVKCGTCGFGFSGGYFGVQSHKRRHHSLSHYFYRDSGSTIRGKRVCSSYYIGMRLLDDLILNSLKKILIRLSTEKQILRMLENVLKPLVKKEFHARTLSNEIRRIRCEIGDMQPSLRQTPGSALTGERIGELLEKEWVLVQRGADVATAHRLLKNSTRIARKIISYYGSCLAGLDTLSVWEKRTILRNVVKEIEIDKKNNAAKLYIYKVPRNIDVHFDLIGLGAKITFVSIVHLPRGRRTQFVGIRKKRCLDVTFRSPCNKT